MKIQTSDKLHMWRRRLLEMREELVEVGECLDALVERLESVQFKFNFDEKEESDKHNQLPLM